jgi:hypothetical protein
MFLKEQGFKLPFGRRSLNCPPPSPRGHDFAQGKKGLSCSLMYLKPFFPRDMIVPGKKKV